MSRGNRKRWTREKEKEDRSGKGGGGHLTEKMPWDWHPGKHWRPAWDDQGEMAMPMVLQEGFCFK